MPFSLSGLATSNFLPKQGVSLFCYAKVYQIHLSCLKKFVICPPRGVL
uniref:Uncharacterized protein n=1 Tax=Arundo donax TaxID=35708 RepID=A0A0A9HP39_ARUDO